MQHLEVSGVVRPLQLSLGAKRLIIPLCKNTGKSSHASYFHFWHLEFNNTKSNFLLNMSLCVTSHCEVQMKNRGKEAVIHYNIS